MNTLVPKNVQELQKALEGGREPKFLFFWGHTPKRPDTVDQSCMSQWFPSKFRVDDVEYLTAEHWMMAEKARLFGDEKNLEAILKADHPGAAKKLGRQVQNFDSKVWESHCFSIVVAGNRAKFSQNPEMRGFLLRTGNKILVEASPYDKIWGIGLKGDDPKALRVEEWQGENLLGFALMEVRSELQSGLGE